MYEGRSDEKCRGYVIRPHLEPSPGNPVFCPRCKRHWEREEGAPRRHGSWQGFCYGCAYLRGNWPDGDMTVDFVEHLILRNKGYLETVYVYKSEADRPKEWLER